MAADGQSGGEPITIKKYANRRLYNTATSSYVTLDDLCQMVKENKDFVVFDAKSGEDITRSVLTQIIVEEESKGQNLLPIGFLRQLIGFYGDSLQSLVPRYLDHSMTSFASNQDQMRSHMQNAFDGIFPFGSLEDMSKQNMAMVEQAMRMFSPFGETKGEAPAAGSTPKDPAASAAAKADKAATAEDSMLDELKRQIEALQQQVASLSDNPPK
ncbi:MAG TPA: polyhydroxyalkanoate synthesis repressor PhaR [Alphaproteobacteria bacterium]|nr:polyhydroxyalkanoate synthesis repressor PhaR [Alphaproteobacteria bacterium]